MSQAIYDYSEPYSRLRHKYKDGFQKLIAERVVACVTVSGLTMKNGFDLRFMFTPAIQDLTTKVAGLLRQTKVDESTKTVLFEGFYSSVIEGAKTTIPETIRLINGERKPSDKSERMVFNNVKLISEYFNKPFPFTESAVLSAWSSLVEDACDNENMRGEKYRNGQVVVGDEIHTTFEPPQYTEVQGHMDRLFSFFRNPVACSPIIQAIIIHYYFAYVHPFCDGNGRMARFLLQQWLIQNPQTSKFRFISLSGAVNESRVQYYRALENSENQLNDITYFIEYYLRVMELQLQRSMALFGADTDLNVRQRSISEKISRSGITRAKYAQMYKVSASTAAKDLNELVSLGDFRVIKDKNGTFRYLKVII